MRSAPIASRESSPRTWGCFCACGFCLSFQAVFPTHVGVFLHSTITDAPACGLPHARGGVSGFRRLGVDGGQSSPRTWGCFYPCRGHGGGESVFPTHVGVFLLSLCAMPCAICLPHARGGVSTMRSAPIASRESSPRTWGCFCALATVRWPAWVFPTHVGVFPIPWFYRALQGCLPHARGGVSSPLLACPRAAWSSPRTWGCFRPGPSPLLSRWVFPTHVGVFLPRPATSRPPQRLPHARGGVSCKSVALFITT